MLLITIETFKTSVWIKLLPASVQSCPWKRCLDGFSEGTLVVGHQLLGIEGGKHHLEHLQDPPVQRDLPRRHDDGEHHDGRPVVVRQNVQDLRGTQVQNSSLTRNDAKRSVDKPARRVLRGWIHDLSVNQRDGVVSDRSSLNCNK